MKSSVVNSRSVRAVALAIALALIWVWPASAMTVSPLVLEMGTGGSSNKAALRVTNDGTKPLPVEVNVFRLEVGEHGESKLTAAPEDFVAVPAQAMVPAGASQTVRIQWAGRADIQKSQSYIIAVNQVPVKFGDTSSGVQMVFNFSVVVNVAAPGSKSALTLKNVGTTLDAKSEVRPTITVVNSGTRHASLDNASLVLTGENYNTTISGSMFRQILGVGLVQPGKQRTFVLPIQVPRNIRNLSGKLDYQAARVDATQP